MNLSNLEVRNFRLLKNISLSIEKESTVIVGRNNSGKTSLTEIFRRLINDNNPKFVLEDFSLSSIKGFKKAIEKKIAGETEDLIRKEIPSIEITLTITYDKNSSELGPLSDFIIDLDENSNEVIIKIKYQLNDGRVNSLFDGITGVDDPEFFKLIADRIQTLYSATVYAIDPTNPSNVRVIELHKFRNLVCVGFINAQRGLDDITHTEKDVLGKILAKLFKTSQNESAPADMKSKSQALNNIVKEMQTIADGEFNELASKLLPALQIFGYPGLSDPNISTETILKTDSLLDKHTRIRYKGDGGISLPETYNGLGSRNLIYILFQLFEFFRDYQSKKIIPGIYLVFIEEPEAHLHPQMQEVFIRQISNIAKMFARDFNNGKDWSVQFIVTTHSTHIANEASFDSIKYFLTVKSDGIETKIKDLRAEFKGEDSQADKEFLHKYLTLTKCDLFFADKAMLIEGACERLLMPKFIEKIDSETGSSLSTQYISTIEIGGSYAHHFFKFLDFLELNSLIITDIDSAAKTEIENKKGEKQIIYPKELVCKSSHCANSTINKWFPKESNGYFEIAVITSKKLEEKLLKKRQIAYQISEIEKGACGRSFEEAFILANPKIFDVEETEIEQIETQIQSKALEHTKTDFALYYAIDKTDWNVPKYIKEGLVWLSKAGLEIGSPKSEVVKATPRRQRK